jgi:hypothetical protein
MEAQEHRVLAEAFHSSLKLSYPVALAGPDLQGGAFGRIEGVPTLVVLDAGGCEVSRKTGLMEERELEAALDTALGR